MKFALAVVILLLSCLNLRAQTSVVRYFDLSDARIVKSPVSGCLPVILQKYAGSWHSICYYPGDSAVLFSGSYEDIDGRIPTGIFVYRHRSGAKASIYEYKSGHLEGESRLYSAEGNLRATARWIAGKQHGPERHYREDSSLCAILHWRDGVMDSAKSFHRNGVLAENTVRSRKSKHSSICRDESGTIRNCDIFADRLAIAPLGFEAYCSKELGLRKITSQWEDSVMYLELFVDENGRFSMHDLYRRRDGLPPALTPFKLFWETINILSPDMESTGTPEMRNRIREKLGTLQRGVPAYEHGIAVPSLLTMPVKLL